MNNNCDCKNCEHWERCEWMLLLSSPTLDYHINAGDKIAQALLLEHKSYLFNIQSDTERTGGFGSTGA